MIGGIILLDRKGARKFLDKELREIERPYDIFNDVRRHFAW